MITLQDILYGVLLPAAIALTVMLVAWRPWSSGSPKGYWGGALAIGAAFIAALINMQPRPAFPPALAEDWLFHVAWMVVIVGLVLAFVKVPFAVRAVIAAVTSAAVTYLVLQPLIKRTWSAQESAIWVGSISAGMTLVFVLHEWISEKKHDASVPLVMALTAGGLGLFMMFSNSQSYGQRAGVLAAATAAITVVAIWSKKLSLARGGVLAFVLLFGGLLTTCYAYPDKVVPYRLLLIAAAPIVGLLPAITPLKGWKRWTAVVLLTALPLGGALLPAGLQFMKEFDAPKDDASAYY